MEMQRTIEDVVLGRFPTLSIKMIVVSFYPSCDVQIMYFTIAYVMHSTLSISLIFQLYSLRLTFAVSIYVLNHQNACI